MPPTKLSPRCPKGWAMNPRKGEKQGAVEKAKFPTAFQEMADATERIENSSLAPVWQLAG